MTEADHRPADGGTTLDEPRRRSASPLLRSRAAAVAGAVVTAGAIGTTVMLVIHRPPLADMTSGDLLTRAMRTELLRSLAVWTAVAAVGMAAVLHRARRRGGWPTTLGELAAGMWPLTLVPVALYVFDARVWLASPLLLYAVTTAACLICVVWTEWPPAHHRAGPPSRLQRHGPTIAVVLAIAAYVVYVSIHTILNHYSLGTAAFDLGIHENVLWNTLHGEFFQSSLEDGSHLGVHTSFVLLLILPVYALVPATETLLVIQSVALGLAALPLYLLARRVLGADPQALIVALLWLTHPAVGGANFFDFHAAALAPVLLFTSFCLWHRRSWIPFWITITLVLSVKEDLAIVVVLLGLVTLITGIRRQGWALVAVGAAAYLVLQHGVIPHFAGRDHSYAWYYTDLIPYGEGPGGLLTTVLLNPIYSLEVALTRPKMLYLFQLFAPLALLPFVTARGWLLMSYGLASSLLATRPALSQLGFHYALPLLCVGFFAALLAIEDRPPPWRARALTAAVMLAVVTCFHYGMIWPRHNFSGGFNRVDFDYSAADRARRAELLELVAQIPAEGSVLASENLVPHVARRRVVETERFAHTGRPVDVDAILVHDDDTPGRLEELPALDGLEAYEIRDRSADFVLFLRRR